MSSESQTPAGMDAALGQNGERDRRLRAMVGLAADIAHRIRNPLGSIAIYASMLERGLEGDDDQRSLAVSISNEVRRVNAVITNLLTFARETPAQRLPMALGRCLLEAIGDLRPLCALREIEVELDAPDEALEVDVDPMLFRQLLVNLLMNAVEASPDGGRVDILQSVTGDLLRIDIADRGAGLGAVDAERAFDPFFSGHPGRTGLGLTIVHRVAEAHGGTVTLNARPGGGTVATVIIPRSNNAA